MGQQLKLKDMGDNIVLFLTKIQINKSMNLRKVSETNIVFVIIQT